MIVPRARLWWWVLVVGANASAAPVVAQPVTGEPVVPHATAPLPTLVQSADSALEARTREISAVLRCPVCQGESIQDSPAELAQQMRAIVREQLEAGRSADEIKAYFVERYGEWILLEPKMTGLNVALYVFPVLLIVGGLAFLVVVIRRWTSHPASP